ncbi:MAG: 4Fe-4S binding protein [candidate division WS1 bacterium]|jgi:electron transport complex protein RnfB|nr:4Fe-4S binding protein [candidate division WS1 bacterium]
MSDDTQRMNRRKFLKTAGRTAAGVAAVAAAGAVAANGRREEYVWQIDPDKCIACGNCATACVLTPSAAKVVHDVSICGYCDLCFGFFAEQRPGDSEAVENQRCPTAAIIRNFVEEPYYEYMIDEPKCIGCASCVEGCMHYGNGSLIMQVRHDRCVNCNECAIAMQCPADAFVRVPADKPYLLRSDKLAEAEEAAQEETSSAPPTQPAQPPQAPQPPDSDPFPSPLQTPPPGEEFPTDGLQQPPMGPDGFGGGGGGWPPGSGMPGGGSPGGGGGAFEDLMGVGEI